MSAKFTARWPKSIYRTATEAVLLVTSAVMVVPFMWMLTVSLKGRREVFNGQNFVPRLKASLSALGTHPSLAVAILAAVVLTAYSAVPTKEGRHKRLARAVSAALWITSLVLAFSSGTLSGLDFSAYSAVWARVPFARMLVNSSAVAVSVTALQLVTSCLAGYAFSRLDFPGRDKLFWAYASLMLIPQQATLIPAFMLINRLGLVDTYAALVLPFAAAPFGAFMMRQFFMALPKELEEAAVLDGCTRFDVLVRIFVPLAKPGLATLALFSFMTSWNEFLWPLMVTTRREMFTLQVGLDMLKWEAGTDWPVIMAASVLVTLPVIIAFLFTQRRFTRSVAMSGINT
ncbi:MAG: L-arabinose transport system permease protein AraQ [Firmicutes bacterium ADurb.Bin153]|nr:MAG: L-arabinose transport system permease protein AraQ [Firmicutes bacterium ADurb.Bin153]HPU95599.1 carbohydrate ABC transporter permease [Bacillota bacterium]